MAIKKVKNGYQVNRKVGGRNGKRYIKTFKRKIDAERYERFVIDEYENGQPWQPGNKALAPIEVFDHWYKVKGVSLRDGKRRYEYLKKLVLVAKDKQAFYEYRNNRLLKGISKATLNRELSYIRAAYKLAHHDNKITVNPFQNVVTLKEDDVELSYLTNDQIKELLISAALSSNESLIHVVRLSLITGGRWSEIETLRKQDIQNGLIRLTKTKNGRIRHIPVDATYTDNIKPFNPQRLFKPCYYAFRSALKRAKIELPKGQMAHVLRHTFASHFIMNGGDILTLQKILDHSDLKTTQRYAHLAPDYLDTVKKLNPLVYSGCIQPT